MSQTSSASKLAVSGTELPKTHGAWICSMTGTENELSPESFPDPLHLNNVALVANDELLQILILKPLLPKAPSPPETPKYLKH